MSEELKPCPFCSCADIGEVTINPRLEPRHRRFKVYCKVCQCRTSEHKTRKEARIYWNTRAQLPSQRGEAVEVVGYLDAHDCLWNETTHPDRMIPLMTVGQHQRVMAATVPAGCMVVQVELLERLADYLEFDEHGEELRTLLEVKP